MPTHWTYADHDPASDLEQGDFLLPTPELQAALKEAHPHFTNEKFLGFIIITQTCDLVRRPQPAAPYVAVAAVRSLKAVLPRLLRSVCDPWSVGIFPESRRDAARKLLERLFNQNEQALGVFYLHPDADLELGEQAVALLRVSVSLRLDHYNALLASRRGRLKPDFQAKLGWLVANLYGRAASADWGDQVGGPAALSAMINDCLDGPLCAWADDEALQSAKKEKVLPPDVSVEQAVQELERLKPAELKERIADEAVRALEGVARNPQLRLEIGPEQLKAFRQRLINGKLAGLLKPKAI